MKSLANALWAAAVRARNAAKRVGLLGPLDGTLAYIGPRLLRPPGVETEVHVQLGLSIIIPPNFPSYRNFATGLYEPDLTALVLSRVRPDMSFVDVGANIGYYSLLSSRLVAPTGHVYAFEPDPTAYQYLVRNLAKNACANVTPRELAVTEATGTARFTRNQLERGYVNGSSAGSPSSISVGTTSLDAYFSEIHWPRVDIIKLDVEGGEHSALLGMRQTIQRNPAASLIMELNLGATMRSGAGPNELLNVIRTLGFTTAYLVERKTTIALETDALPASRAIHNALFTRPQQR